MNVYGQLYRAQLENRTTDYATTIKGLMWWNTTTGRAMSDDGTNIRAMLRNDQKAIIGNHATAANNIRFHRGADGVLQFVPASDVTAEGTLSTTLSQTSARLENYLDASKPAFGNAGRFIWVTDLAQLQVDTGAAWSGISTGNRIAAIYDFVIGSAGQVTSGDATHSTFAAAQAVASDGNNVLYLEGTFTENITITKKLKIDTHGYGTIIDGTVTYGAGSSYSQFNNAKHLDNITINSGVTGIQMHGYNIAIGKTFFSSGTGTVATGTRG